VTCSRDFTFIIIIIIIMAIISDLELIQVDSGFVSLQTKRN
jgi:hypothetical protein